MSEEQLKAFVAKVQADTSLQEQLKAEGADVVAIAKEAGFMITIDDLTSARSAISENELEEAAGGRNPFCAIQPEFSLGLTLVATIGGDCSRC